MTTSVPPTLTKPNNEEEKQTSMAATVTTSLSPILTNPNDEEAKQTTLPAPLSPALIKLDEQEKETNLPTPLSSVVSKSNNEEEEEKERAQELILSLPKVKGWITNYFYQYQGFWHMMITLQGTIFAQQKFKFQPNDVLLATNPKSGTTWLKALAFAIKNRALYHNSSSTKTVTHPLLVSNPHALVPTIEYMPYFQNFTLEMDEIMKATPRLLATHMPYNSLIESVDSSNFRLVYLCRDPKDVLVSLWHFFDKLDYKEIPLISLQEAFDSFCDGVSYMGPYWDHVLGYYKASLEFPERVLFIKYEDMLSDTVNHVKRFAEFMGCPISLDEEEEGYIQEIVRLCSFENLKNLEVTRKGKLFGGQNNNLFYRNGVVGDSKNYLSPEMMEHIDQITKQKFQGYDIGY